MTNDKEMIELCAKALGFEGNWALHSFTTLQWFPDGTNTWNPLTDQADSDNMACDLEIDTSYAIDGVFCGNRYGDLDSDIRVDHDGTIEGRRRAVRQVRVAEEMGRAKL